MRCCQTEAMHNVFAHVWLTNLFTFKQISYFHVFDHFWAHGHDFAPKSEPCSIHHFSPSSQPDMRFTPAQTTCMKLGFDGTSAHLSEGILRYRIFGVEKSYLQARGELSTKFPRERLVQRQFARFLHEMNICISIIYIQSHIVSCFKHTM